ncbi:DUF2092 domain-containing protein [Rhizobium etli]|uniref:DUF2092 domain-containing protein n=1 Tax=Rhizobium etli TaxID=29449 RepID=UPI003B58666C
MTPHLQKIQFASSGQVVVSRPNKVHATRIGGFADIEMIFDGKQGTIPSKDAKSSARLTLLGRSEVFQ